MKKILVSFGCALIILSCQQADKTAQIVPDSAATMNDTSNSANTLDNQIILNHAFDAVIWGIPLVNYAAMQEAMTRDVKGQYNQIVYWSKPLNWKNKTLTPNTEALYFMPFFSTEKSGAMVLEISAAEGGSITGTIMDCWQSALEDVGPAGVDKGKGGKYLILPDEININSS